MEWKISREPVDYPTAVDFMERRVADIAKGTALEMIWLLEHPPLYTSGTSAKAGDLLDTKRFPIYQTGRGGEWTYHGPGQRIAYVMLDLNKRGRDVRRHVQSLEQWLIDTLKTFSVEGFTREGRVGVWVSCSPLRGEQMSASPQGRSANRGGDTPHGSTGAYGLVSPALPQGESKNEEKIAALGIRVRKWVSYHGISINVAPDLTHYRGIVPCGISGYGVTSLKERGIDVSMADIDKVLQETFFG